MVALQTRSQGTGNIAVTQDLTKEALLNSAWDKGELLDLPRQLPQTAGESCATCSSSWLLMLLWHTYTLLMLLFLSFIFPCAVWKATPFCTVPVTVLWTYFHFSFSHMKHLPMSSRANQEDRCQLWLRGWGMPQAASHGKQRWVFLSHNMQAVSGIPWQLHRNSGILMKEMQVSLLPLLLSERSMDESVMSCCCIITVITGENSQAQGEA